MKLTEIKPLTALRFFFALMIFFHHTRTGSNSPTWNYMVTKIFAEGFIGVSFFFVLSGFILSYAYERKLAEGRTGKGRFWLARFARIYPLHLLALLASTPLYFSQINTSIFFSNLTLIQSHIPDWHYFFNCNTPAWSISDEAFFYLLFPFMVLLNHKSRRLFQALAVGLALTVILKIWLSPTNSETTFHYDRHFWFLYVCPITRLADFCLGMLIFQLFSKLHDKVTMKMATALEVSSILLLVIVFSYHGRVAFEYRQASFYWIPICFLILSFSFSKGQLSGLLSHPVFLWLGRISFAFYLIHLPLVNLYDWHLKINNLPFRMLSLLGVSILLAHLLHTYVENPMNNWILRKKKRLVPGPIITDAVQQVARNIGSPADFNQSTRHRATFP